MDSNQVTAAKFRTVVSVYFWLTRCYKTQHRTISQTIVFYVFILISLFSTLRPTRGLKTIETK